MRHHNYKQAFTTLALKTASELARTTENKIKEYIDNNKPIKTGLCAPLLTDAERNTYLAEEREHQYSSEKSKRNLGLH